MLSVYQGGVYGGLGDICPSMFCLVPDDTRGVFCVEHRAAPGTSCGPGKWCEAGECVANPKAPWFNMDQCPMGDEVTLVDGRGCPEAVSSQPDLCSLDHVRAACCSSCGLAHTATTAHCPLGDQHRDCRPSLCHTSLPDGTPYARDCCRTCNFDLSRWACADSPLGVDGQPCQAAVRVGQVQGCYNATLAFRCCASCQGHRNPSAQPGCEYGDLLPETCKNHKNARQTCSRQLQWQCCQTCRDNDALLRDVKRGMTSSGTPCAFPPPTPLLPLQLLMWCFLMITTYMVL
ncbi:uncharacterized protein LOC143301547 [Babylonia areolata]|uniref:uncharacterized protein LOC143301547 n=1 Tax=Babylonia areolata TaxID=304850 RepID=UPI003FD0AB07